MKLILRYLRPLYGTMCAGITIKMLATFFELLLPYLLSYILDEVVPTGHIGQIILFGCAMIGAAFLALLGNVLANRNAARVARDASRHIRHDLFDATMHLTSRETDAFTVPSLESRLTSDTYNVHHFIGMAQRIGVRAPLLLLGGAIITLVLDWRLALILLCTLPLIGIAVFAITRHGLPLYTKTQKSVDRMVRIVREDCNGVRVIKALSKEEYENRRYQYANEDLSRNERHAGTTMAASQPLIGLFLNLGLIAVIVCGAFWVDRGISKPGRIIAFLQYFTLMSGAMTTITRIIVQYTKSLASANRIAEVLDVAAAHSKEETTSPAAEATANAPTQTSQTEPQSDVPYLAFRDVCFSYNGKRDNLSHISFSLSKGGTLGVIGATGSGKSTLVQLLLCFYEADSGSISIEGKEAQSVPTEEWRAHFGVVMQNDFISADTIAQNIRFGRDISDEDIAKAAQLAQASEFIEAFPDGYAHELAARGTNISGGQRQRILIARAIAAHPDILILDDASSALDYKTDAALRHTLRDTLHTTTVVVAQRVSSVMYADHILVLEQGEVIGAGKHEELLATCPAYREISDSQMGGAFLE